MTLSSKHMGMCASPTNHMEECKTTITNHPLDRIYLHYEPTDREYIILPNKHRPVQTTERQAMGTRLEKSSFYI